MRHLGECSDIAKRQACSYENIRFILAHVFVLSNNYQKAVIVRFTFTDLFLA